MKKIFIITIIIFISICSFYLGNKLQENKMNKQINFLNSEIEVKKNEIINLGKQNSELQKQIEDLKTQKQNDKKEEYKHPIDRKEQKCLDKSITTADTLNCCIIAEKEWEKEINKYLNLLKKNMTPEQYKLIQKNQYLWQKENKSSNEIITEFIFNHGGTMYFQLAASDYTEAKKQRAEFLKWIYDVHSDNLYR